MAPSRSTNKLCLNRDFGTRNATECARQVKRNCPGQKVYRNPFLNFLREYRQNHCGLSVTESAKKAGEMWKCMSIDQKRPYVQMAEKAQRSKRRTRGNTRRNCHERKYRRSYTSSSSRSRSYSRRR